MKVPICKSAVLALALVAVHPVVSSAFVLKSESIPVSQAFAVRGSNGFRVAVAGFSTRADGRGPVDVAVVRGRSEATYRFQGVITETSMRADLGGYGRIDVVLERSGRQRHRHDKCFGENESYEPGTYLGRIEFRGERDFTHVKEGSAAYVPPSAEFGSAQFCQGGRGEEAGGFTRGARIRGVAFSDGRWLRFQINKNRPGGRAYFESSLDERRNGIAIRRETHGWMGPRSFRFNPSLRRVRLDPPTPFAGSARLMRSPNSFSPLLKGGLSISFPGRPQVRIASPNMRVSVVHARLTFSSTPSNASIRSK